MIQYPNCHPGADVLLFTVEMGQVIAFPMSRVRRPRRRVDVFSRHFELLRQLKLWDRMFMACIALVTVVAFV